MSHIHKSILINAPVEKVYNFARDPRRWNTFFVGLGAPEDIKGNGEAGTTVKQNFTMLGIAFPITTRVVDEKLVGTKAYWKGAVEGPLTATNDWNYTAKGPDQTEIAVDIDYTIPGKLLGKITDKLLVEKIQDKAAATTLENFKLLCEAEVAAPVFA